MIHTNMNITHFSFIYSDRNNCYANIWFPNRFNFSNWSLFRKWDPCTVMIVNKTLLESRISLKSSISIIIIPCAGQNNTGWAGHWLFKSDKKCISSSGASQARSRYDFTLPGSRSPYQPSTLARSCDKYKEVRPVCAGGGQQWSLELNRNLQTVCDWMWRTVSCGYLWHIRLCTMDRQASAEVGALLDMARPSPRPPHPRLQPRPQCSLAASRAQASIHMTPHRGLKQGLISKIPSYT